MGEVFYLTQRRNVKAQMMGDRVMVRLTGLNGFSAENAPFDDKGAIAHRRIADYRVAYSVFIF